MHYRYATVFDFDSACGFLSFAVHYAPNSVGSQLIISDITSEVAPKTNRTEIQNEVAIQLSENAPQFEDLHKFESHVSDDQCQDVSAPIVNQSPKLVQDPVQASLQMK
jgi:hypothetical protein